MVHYPYIARETWPLLSALGVFALSAWFLAATIHPVLAAFPAMLLGLGFYLARDPFPSAIPLIPFAILSPIDGTITQLAKIDHPDLGQNTWHIQISMSWFDVMSIFSPVTGKPIREQLVRKLPTPHPKHLRVPVCIKTDEGDEIRLVFTTLHRFSRLYCHAHLGERLGQGQRCGFSRFPCTVDLYLPAYARTHVQAGQRVHARGSCLADLRWRTTLD